MKYILLIFFLISNVDAQAFLLYDTAKIKKIGMAEGLSLNSSLCIIQDHQGIIWIGTSDGLNKYNGVDNLVYKYNFDDSLSLSNNQINCIFEDSRNTIWVGTANGLNVLNPNNTFRKYVADSTSKSISHRYEVHRGRQKGKYLGGNI